jgi:hypothetical protein
VSAELRRTSALAAPADVVWARVTTAAGIGDELWPWLTMSPPPPGGPQTVADAPVGRPWFRSRIRLGGILPVDYDDLCIVALEPGRFLERSATSTQLVWEHERTVAAAPGGGCVVADRVAWTPRARPLAAFGPVYRAVFAWRHRRLRARFGTA